MICVTVVQEDVKDTVEKFLEYFMINHRVSREPETILQAFQISVVRTFLSLAMSCSTYSCF